MKRLYAIYSKRGLWVARTGSQKVVYLFGKERAERIARSMAQDHKQTYTVAEVKVVKK